MKIVIQDTWNEPEDEELIEYCKKKYNTIILDEKSILKLNFKLYDCIFADTTIIQTQFKSPPTYPDCFKSFYKRKIEKQSIDTFLNSTDKKFIKPVNNDKLFDSFICNPKNEYDIQYLNKNKKSNEIYVCEIVNFVNEYRLFILNNKLYGIQESSLYILPYNVIQSKEPSIEFINDILKHNIYPNCIIDVGMLLNNEFCIVEVNPPFSLSSYDFPIEKYTDYCIKAFKLLS